MQNRQLKGENSLDTEVDTDSLETQFDVLFKEADDEYNANTLVAQMISSANNVPILTARLSKHTKKFRICGKRDARGSYVLMNSPKFWKSGNRYTSMQSKSIMHTSEQLINK